MVGPVGATVELKAGDYIAYPADVPHSFEALEPRLNRLVERDLVVRQATGPELVPGLALTDRGERIREVLAGAWSELEEALLGELGEKDRKKLKKQLGRFVELLRL